MTTMRRTLEAASNLEVVVAALVRTKWGVADEGVVVVVEVA